VDDDRAWLAPGGGELHCGYGAYAFPRRPRERPNLNSMWNLDGKSGTLSSCAPAPLQRFDLLRLALGA
jgi:hypothetical protein